MPDLRLSMDDGADLHVMVAGGDGVPVVLLHDLDASHAVWAPVADRLLQLAPGLRIVMPDLRGHGGSTSVDEPSRKRLVKDMKRLCKELGVAEPVLVGHGWGADIAQACDFAGSVVAINPLMGREPGPFTEDVPRPEGLPGARDAAMLRACAIGATTAKPLRRSRRDAPLLLLAADPLDIDALAGTDALEQASEVMWWKCATRQLPLEMPNAIAAILLSWIEEVA